MVDAIVFSSNGKEELFVKLVNDISNLNQYSDFSLYTFLVSHKISINISGYQYPERVINHHFSLKDPIISFFPKRFQDLLLTLQANFVHICYRQLEKATFKFHDANQIPLIESGMPLFSIKLILTASTIVRMDHQLSLLARRSVIVPQGSTLEPIPSLLTINIHLLDNIHPYSSLCSGYQFHKLLSGIIQDKFFKQSTRV